ncbi:MULTISPECIES: hypothetical protein [Delftia]|jgi:hypothetical protein
MTLEMGKHDQERLAQIQANRERIEGPRIGDFVVFSTGQIERFSHAWDDCLQTSPSGSFFLHASGSGEFSGALNPHTPRQSLELTRATLPGTFWFFRDGRAQPGGRVDFSIPCRVFRTAETYTGYLGTTFQMDSHRLQTLKALLIDQGV